MCGFKSSYNVQGRNLKSIFHARSTGNKSSIKSCLWLELAYCLRFEKISIRSLNTPEPSSKVANVISPRSKGWCQVWAGTFPGQVISAAAKKHFLKIGITIKGSGNSVQLRLTWGCPGHMSLWITWKKEGRKTDLSEVLKELPHAPGFAALQQQLHPPLHHLAWDEGWSGEGTTGEREEGMDICSPSYPQLVGGNGSGRWAFSVDSEPSCKQNWN